MGCNQNLEIRVDPAISVEVESSPTDTMILVIINFSQALKIPLRKSVRGSIQQLRYDSRHEPCSDWPNRSTHIEVLTTCQREHRAHFPFLVMNVLNLSRS